MTYQPKIDDYVKWRNVEGWVYFTCSEYLTIEISVKNKSEESYKEKLETLKESYFKSSPKRSESEVLTESTDQEVSGSMAAYMQVLSRSVQK